jgi:predicted nucleic acid-binding protein
MKIYLDSSAVIKRVVNEPESPELVAAIDAHHDDGDMLVSSSLAWVEVARVLRAREVGGRAGASAVQADDALAGVAEHPLGPGVVSLARRLGPSTMRSLDAIHLGSALLLDADLVFTYDRRLAEACVHNGLPVAAPGPAVPCPSEGVE